MALVASTSPLSATTWIGIKNETGADVRHLSFAFVDDWGQGGDSFYVRKIEKNSGILWFNVGDKVGHKMSPMMGFKNTQVMRWLHGSVDVDDHRILRPTVTSNFVLCILQADGYIDFKDTEPKGGQNFVVGETIENLILADLPADPTTFSLEITSAEEDVIFSKLRSHNLKTIVPREFLQDTLAVSCYTTGYKAGWFSSLIPNLGEIHPFHSAFIEVVLPEKRNKYGKSEIEIYTKAWHRGFLQGRNNAVELIRNSD